MSVLSLVVPCYNEGASLRPFTKAVLEVVEALPDIKTEIIFIDDGSQDDTLKVIKELEQQHPQVSYISFSRNFGKESAILAGLEQAEGDYATVMDADLQHPPSLLPDMLHAVRDEGYDCAATRRISRKGEPPIRSFFARSFYRIINQISDTTFVSGACDYKLLSRKARLAVVSMPEYNRFSKGLFEWIGFRTKWLEFENVERVAGETKWSFWKLFKYSLEGIVAFSTAPLSMVTILGLTFMLMAGAAISLLSLRQIIFHCTPDGWTSLICIILMLSGVQLLCLGVFGKYIAKMYMEVKRRPLYIVAENSRGEGCPQAGGITKPS